MARIMKIAFMCWN